MQGWGNVSPLSFSILFKPWSDKKNKSCGFQCLELAGCRVPPCSGLMLSRNPSTTALREGKWPQVSMDWEPLKDGLPASGETVHICSRCDPCLGPSTLLMVLQGASVWKADGRDRPEAMARGKSNSHTFWASTNGQKIGSQVGYFLSDLLSRSQNTGDTNSLIIGRNRLVPIPSHRQSHPAGYGWGESLGILWRLKKKKKEQLHLFWLALAYFVWLTVVFQNILQRRKC